MRLTVVILFVVLVLSLFALALVQSAGAVQPELSTTSTPDLGNSYDPAGYGLPSTMAGYKTFAVLTSENTACRMPGEKRLVLQAMEPNAQEFLKSSNSVSIAQELQQRGFSDYAQWGVTIVGPGTQLDQFFAQNESWNQQRRQYGCVTSGPAATPSTIRLGKLAYIAQGDLWVRALPDGEPKQLTTGGKNNTPLWSPSGEWIALRRDDGRVWVTRESGADATALEESDPDSAYAWSPITDTLAFISIKGNLSITQAPDWRTQIVVTVRDEPGFVFPFAWSPDGEWLAYEDDHLLAPVHEGEYPLRYTSLQRIRPDGRDRMELVNAGNPSDYGLIPAGWSGDSRRVYYWIDPMYSGSLLADGTQMLSTAPNGLTTQLLGPAVGMLAHRDFWSESPDGKRLFLTAGGGRETWSNKRVAMVDLANGRLTYLTDSNTAAFSPAWSPDGARLAYVAAPDIGFVGGGPLAKMAAAERRIWIMDADGFEQHALTGDSIFRDEFPQWSRDGQFILFARLNEADEGSIWLVPPGGGAPTQVAGLGISPLVSWFGYYGYIDWTENFDWWKGP